MRYFWFDPKIFTPALHFIAHMNDDVMAYTTR